MLFRFRFFNKEIAVQAAARNMRKNKVLGYTNRCLDGNYILMLDYDRMPIEWVVEELKRLQHDNNLSDIYFFESSPMSYHAVCLDKMPYQELINVMRQATIDDNYITIPSKFGRRLWTLRISSNTKGTPRWMGVLRRQSLRHKSLAHAKLLDKIWDVDAQKNIYGLEDMEEKLVLSAYKI